MNEIFNPSRVDDMYSRPAAARAAAIAQDRSTNYGVVRLELIERLYETLYMQRLKYSSEEAWPHQIVTNCRVTRAEDSPVKDRSVRLVLDKGNCAHDWGQAMSTEELDVDAVIVAAGYLRDAHELLLTNCRSLLPGGETPDKKWSVARNYRVQFEKNTVSQDAGIWLQGCNESTHGVSWPSTQVSKDLY